jgi:hypothetical protein
MKKIRLSLENEDVQAGLIISGFAVVFAILFLFFF